jgi:hypothetical protein
MVTLLAMLALMQGAASDYWTVRGVPAPCASTVVLVDDLAGVGQARLGGCLVELDRGFVRSRYATLKERGAPRRWKRDDALQVCLVVLHEEGHARGLPHSEDGIMAERGMWAERPEECLRVIRPLVRKRSAERVEDRVRRPERAVDGDR